MRTDSDEQRENCHITDEPILKHSGFGGVR